MSSAIPREFLWRRLHSLVGLWFVIFLIEHLVTNSQAALFLGDDGKGFVHAVNFLHSLPFLPVIEIALLGVPIAIHGILGVQYIFSAKYNSRKGDGSAPSLPDYPRNRAYTWQRLSSWVLMVGIILHVIQMRFIDYPITAPTGSQEHYMVRVTLDEGLYTLADRLEVDLFSREVIEEALESGAMPERSLGGAAKQTGFFDSLLFGPQGETFSSDRAEELIERQFEQQRAAWIKALGSRKVRDGEVIAVSDEFGKAVLLSVRNTFKSPLMMVLYTPFVLAAVFHAFNGLWTFLITWGVILTQASQLIMRKMAFGLMALMGFLGLAAIWLTYWINLKN